MVKLQSGVAYMRWIELIKIRTSGSAVSDLLAQLPQQLREFERQPTIEEAGLLHHASVEGDLAAYLIINRPGPSRDTREGLSIAEFARDFGFVDYQRWEYCTEPQEKQHAK
jgi:hypothetical protein